MTTREPQRINKDGVTYRIEVEVTERIEIVERHTQLPIPLHLRQSAGSHVRRPVMDGLDVTLRRSQSTWITMKSALREE